MDELAESLELRPLPNGSWKHLDMSPKKGPVEALALPFGIVSCGFGWCRG